MQEVKVNVTREFSDTVDGIVRLFEILIRNSNKKEKEEKKED